MSDYVSVKHIHCPAINALIAAYTEDVLGGFNNEELFISCRSLQTQQSFHAQSVTDQDCRNLNGKSWLCLCNLRLMSKSGLPVYIFDIVRLIIRAAS